MRNLAIPALVLLPFLADLAQASQDARPNDTPPRALQARTLGARGGSVSDAECGEIGRPRLAPRRRGEP